MNAPSAYEVVARVTDPELPMLTLADLGVLREVTEADGAVTVTITPTYSGCPAMATMRDDLVHRLRDHGYADVRVTVALSPPWSSDWITERGRAALVDHGISPPAPREQRMPRRPGPTTLTLLPGRRALGCSLCGGGDVTLVSEFGSTACKALYRCITCGEPFDHVKEI